MNSKIVLSFFFILLCCITVNAQRPYITVWKTDNPGASADNRIAFYGKGSFSYTWELENNPEVKGSGFISGLESDYFGDTLIFPAAGIYRMFISPTGTFAHYFLENGDAQKLLKIEQWGDVVWSSMAITYGGCSNLTVTAIDVPNLSNVTSMNGMFSKCPSITDIPNINSWNTSSVTDMGSVFLDAKLFNNNISNWNTVNVNYMGSMFSGAESFNQDIGKWNTSKVIGMEMMFDGALHFNQDISKWDVSKVTNMLLMFNEAGSFNQDISKWDVSNVTRTSSMFSMAYAFNQDISGWNVSKVTDMSSMFSNASLFNQNLGGWDISSLGAGDGGLRFRAFLMFQGSGMDCHNYSQTLIGWAANSNIPSNIFFQSQGITYGPAARAAIDTLISHGWTMDNNSYYDESCVTLPLPKVTAWGTNPISGNANIKVWRDNSQPAQYVKRHSEITPDDNPGTVTGRVTLYFTNLDFKDFNNQTPAPMLLLPNADDPATIDARKANLLIEKHGGVTSDGSGLPGTYPGATETINPIDEDIVWNNSGAYWEVSFNVTGFSGFFVKTIANALPVTYTTFNIAAQKDRVTLQWATATEINSRKFKIQRSVDGISFETIGYMAAAGNSSKLLNYVFNDMQGVHLKGQALYYRIVEIDVDGREFYSVTKSVKIPGNDNSLILVYNPVKNEALLKYECQSRENIQVRIINHLGKIVSVIEQTVQSGTNEIRLQTSNLARGIYEVILSNNKNNYHVRMMKE